MKLHFTKMEGAGNDFIVVNALSGEVLAMTESTARSLCDRRFGIGADQILILLHSSMADFKMEINNADGKPVEMCGNGIRCVAKYIHDHYLSSKKELSIETLGGIVKPEIILGHKKNKGTILWVKVDMGKPTLDGEKIPVNHRGRILDFPLKVQKKDYKITCIAMGNPHCVLFINDVDVFPVEEWGPLIEHHEFFPSRVNVEFVQILDKRNIKMRVWERGTGETLACGTGACAAVVASILHEKTDREVNVHLKGGDLEISWNKKTDHVEMAGPATTVYDGVIEI